MRPTLRNAFLAAVLGALPTVCLAGLVAAPIELPGQAEPSVVADGGRGFVLTWIDRGPEGLAQLRYAALDRAGVVMRAGEIASGRDWFVNWADFPSLAIADNGDWVAFFLRTIDPAKPYAYEVRTTRSTDAGRTWSTPVLLHDDGTPTEHGFVSLLPDGDDRVLAMWLDGRRTPAPKDGEMHGGHAVTTLRTAILQREGGPRDGQELDDLTCDCCTTDAVRAGSGPLVVYRDRTGDEIRDVHWLQRGAQGWSSPRPVHADRWNIAGCPVNGPALALAGATPVVAWPTMAGEAYHVRVARRADVGWSSPIELESGPGVLGRVDAAPWTNDGVLVSWLGGSAKASVLRVAQLDRELGEVSRLDVVSLPPGRMTGMPRMASHDGLALLAWTSPEVRGGKIRGVLLRAREQVATAPAWLDPAERDALEQGMGYGMARAAEAHALPGPKHVLEHAEALGLDAAQRAEMEGLRAAMHAAAVTQGRAVLRAELALDRELAAPDPDPVQVEALSTQAGAARGRLRAVHLDAHVAAARVLSAEQRARYVELRTPMR